MDTMRFLLLLFIQSAPRLSLKTSVMSTEEYPHYTIGYACSLYKSTCTVWMFYKFGTWQWLCNYCPLTSLCSWPSPETERKQKVLLHVHVYIRAYMCMYCLLMPCKLHMYSIFTCKSKNMAWTFKIGILTATR